MVQIEGQDGLTLDEGQKKSIQNKGQDMLD